MEHIFASELQSLLNQARINKENASTSDVARNWAIVITDLEKVFAYVEFYIVNTSVVGGEPE